MFELSLDIEKSLLENYLYTKKWLNKKEKIRDIEKPGEGNMNVVLRINTENRSLILKQARPYVQKYPQIPAPIERIKVERQFYNLLKNKADIQGFLPKIYGFDTQNYIMAMEDLGEGTDFTFIYQKNQILLENTLHKAIYFLNTLHNSVFEKKIQDSFPKNIKLRRLNHEHLCVYPFMENNGFDLDTIQSGLQSIAMTYKTDSIFKNKLKTLGKTYLSKGKTLLHGDYYPGSWLKVGTDLKVIDPEFCFFGCAEYDFGVMVAHLKMAQIEDNIIENALKLYSNKGFNKDLATQFTGMEIMRRIIGLAQLPLDLTLNERAVLLKEAYMMI
jgi:5-methylthioribose kinase